MASRGCMTVRCVNSDGPLWWHKNSSTGAHLGQPKSELAELRILNQGGIAASGPWPLLGCMHVFVMCGRLIQPHRGRYTLPPCACAQFNNRESIFKNSFLYFYHLSLFLLYFYHLSSRRPLHIQQGCLDMDAWAGDSLASEGL